MFPRRAVSLQMNVQAELRQRVAGPLASLDSDEAKCRGLLEMIRPAQDAKFGDYQANFAMPLGKQLGKRPRDIAAGVIAQVDLADMFAPPEVAGPGFINLRLKDAWLQEHLNHCLADERLGVPLAQ